jgi:hypothetical protein
MRKYVDVDEIEEITEFVYTNGVGEIEGVRTSTENDSCIILWESENEVRIFKKDIPKMIKTLECAMNEWGVR